ncbi:MAG: hypothetical protein QOG89_3449 [Thermomicrobiales bacterium]|nr:hypothetical protein [Thermomicrobiales bacterium]
MPAKAEQVQQTTGASGIPQGLGYAAKRRWLIENGREAEAEAMRLAVNTAGRLPGL